MNYPPPVGTQVTLDFFLEPVNKSIHATGTVVRSIHEAGPDGQPPGMAVQFSELDKEGMRFIELVVAKFNRHHPSKFLEVPDEFYEDVDRELEATGAATPGKPTLEVRLSYSSGDHFLQEQAEMLKEGEVFVRTDSPRPRGTPVTLTLLLKKENRMISNQGVVVWSRSGEGRKGMAVRVVEPSPEFRQLTEAPAAAAP